MHIIIKGGLLSYIFLCAIVSCALISRLITEIIFGVFDIQTLAIPVGLSLMWAINAPFIGMLIKEIER